MTEALIIDISKMGTVKVLPRSAVRKYKEKPLAKFAGELQVDAFLEESVLHSADRVRVTAQLVDANSGRTCGLRVTIAACRTY
jgi:TolB-like protein